MSDAVTTMLLPASMFIVQLGQRHLAPTFTTIQKKLFATPLVQSIIVFALFFNMTRQLHVAALMTLLFYLIIFVLLNENHPMNWLPRTWLQKEGFNLNNADVYENYRRHVSDRFGTCTPD